MLIVPHLVLRKYLMFVDYKLLLKLVGFWSQDMILVIFYVTFLLFCICASSVSVCVAELFLKMIENVCE